MDYQMWTLASPFPPPTSRSTVDWKEVKDFWGKAESHCHLKMLAWLGHCIISSNTPTVVHCTSSSSVPCDLTVTTSQQAVLRAWPQHLAVFHASCLFSLASSTISSCRVNTCDWDTMLSVECSMRLFVFSPGNHGGCDIQMGPPH